jgi:toxin ParE1/3/4
MKPIVFHPEAILELDDAVAYYAERSVKAARGFEEAIEAGVHAIARQPKAHAFLRDTGKRALRLARYPYLIIFEELEDRIWIDAVAHSKRRPDYWRKRRHD